jgi:hypothetical protein
MGFRIIGRLREPMRNFEYRKIGAYMQGGTVERAVLEVEIKRRYDDDAVSEGAVFEAEAVKRDRFVVKAFIRD